MLQLQDVHLASNWAWSKEAVQSVGSNRNVTLGPVRPQVTRPSLSSRAGVSSTTMADTDANLFLSAVRMPPCRLSSLFFLDQLPEIQPDCRRSIPDVSYGATHRRCQLRLDHRLSSGSPKTSNAGVCADANSSTGCMEGQLDRTSWADFPWPNFSPSPAIR